MEALKRARRLARREFDILHRELEALLQEEQLKGDVINIKFKLFYDSYEVLQTHDNNIIEQLAIENLQEAEENKEWDDMREYKIRAEQIRQLKEKKVPSCILPVTESVHGSASEGRVRNFKLPTVQIKKFTGALEDWLGFWAQFQNIDEDPTMHGSDKFWYLLQSLQPGTDAHELATGYPLSNENYPVVIDALKRQYGNEDLQLQVYLRKLLKLVISNVESKDKLPVKSLHLKLDSHLRALKTLKLEKADPATWLFPLVESCLPEAILDNWQRSEMSTQDGSKMDPPKTRLDLLMTFVGREVEIQQRIEIARSFAKEQHSENKGQKVLRTTDNRSKDKRVGKESGLPTLASFHAGEGKLCVFCERSNHESRDCFRAKNMSYEKKMEVLRTKGLCYRCTGKHLATQCSGVGMECEVCKKKHLTILCRELNVKRDRRSFGNRDMPVQKRQRIEAGIQTNTSSANMECTSEVALKTLLVRVKAEGTEKIVRAFIDEGSQRSYILNSTARQLKLKPEGKQTIIHCLFGGKKTEPTTHNLYEVELQSLDRGFQQKFKLRDQEKISGNLPNINKCPEIVRELLEKGVTLCESAKGHEEIEILLGADMYPRIITGKIEELHCGAVAIYTRLGWTLMGELGTSVLRDSIALDFLTMSVTDGGLTTLWNLEAIGIKDPSEEETKKKKEAMALELFYVNISRCVDGRYSVRLPWRENEPWLPTNREMAYKRLQSASRKLKERGFYEIYHKIFQEWENEGFIERVHLGTVAERVHYLPHRPVIKESLTTPVRPVFDASCRVGKSASLNDCLHTGESYVQVIPDIIQKFREKRVAFVADIRKAFQMIGVDRNERDRLRFLWWADNEMKQVIEYRHARVLFGATCSPFILAAVINFHVLNLPEKEMEIGLKLLSTLYVDNVASSENSIAEYLEFRKRTTEIMKQARMDLRMWLSNVDEFENEETHVISVLGLLWDRNLDELFVNLRGINMPNKVTKRTVLSTAQKLYDPIGFTSPAALQMKLLLQQTWSKGIKWDEELPEAETKLFRKWCKEVTDLEKIRIPRLSTAGETDKQKWQLHIFCDSSKNAYSTVIFLRITGDKCAGLHFLSAKSRVAPVKTLTIPKLELMGCLIGARLVATVKQALDLQDIPEVYWSDSLTALAWINRDDQWGTFVANRTRAINRLTKKKDWRHVPGVLNPADLPSRGCSPSQLLSSKWWEGPSWLRDDDASWPYATEEANEDEIVSERRKTATVVETSFSSLCIASDKSFSWLKLVRITGWVRRFLHNKFVKDIARRKYGRLSKEELKKAELIFVRNLQREAFPPEEREKLKGLELIVDDWGILRTKTRLVYRDDPPAFKFPMLLPSNREEVRQLIRDFHRYYCHAGVGFMMMVIRKKFWLIKSRHTIKKVITKSHRCRRYAAKPMIPQPAPLPLDRVKNAEVFEIIGVDLAGPLILRNGKKAWLVIFTCAVYRAVHFELVKNISTKAFLVALEKFIQKYRRPAIIYSDNGTNFRGADNLFKRIDWEELEKNDGTERIIWKFNPVTSSWWGGCFERLIRTAKELLRRTVGKGSLSWQELQNIIVRIADVMNDRPLTYVSENVQDLEPLTPSLFLHPLGNTDFLERELTEAQQLRGRYKYMKTLQKELKGRFVKEYLSMLINHNPKKPTRKLSVGELVLVGCDNLKRLNWPLGRVVELIPGKDGESRVAKVKTAMGEITRSVQRLFPMEMDHQAGVEKVVRENGVKTRSGRTSKIPNRFF